MRRIWRVYPGLAIASIIEIYIGGDTGPTAAISMPSAAKPGCHSAFTLLWDLRSASKIIWHLTSMKMHFLRTVPPLRHSFRSRPAWFAGR